MKKIVDFLKTLGIRLIFLVIGIPATIFGAIGLYAALTTRGSDFEWPLGIFFFGLCGIIVAFSKKKFIKEIYADTPVEDPPNNDQKTEPL